MSGESSEFSFRGKKEVHKRRGRNNWKWSKRNETGGSTEIPLLAWNRKRKNSSLNKLYHAKGVAIIDIATNDFWTGAEFLGISYRRFSMVDNQQWEWHFVAYLLIENIHVHTPWIMQLQLHKVLLWSVVANKTRKKRTSRWNRFLCEKLAAYKAFATLIGGSVRANFVWKP